MGVSIKDIIQYLNPISSQISNDNLILDVRSIEDKDFSQSSLGWCSLKNIQFLLNINFGTVIISSELAKEYLTINSTFPFNAIIVDNPRKSFAEILRFFFVEKQEFLGVHPSVSIHPTVKYDEQQVTFEPNVVIEKNVKIGDRVIIGANTVIKSGTIIGDDVKIGSNNTIGGVGFGYEPNEEGVYELIPHLGNVILHNKVEIGNNTCIDRAVLGSTILETEVKVDNLVHIAHGVKIGANSLVIANSMIAGSVQIGKNTWVSPSASIKQKLIIGDNALVGMGSVVLKNVEDGAIVAGVPAKKIN
jgi:UDP-3-O-[3-hydroxymyristoyl] glucosamine N-acyltransferase